MGCDTYGRIKGHIRPENIVFYSTKMGYKCKEWS